MVACGQTNGITIFHSLGIQTNAESGVGGAVRGRLEDVRKKLLLLLQLVVHSLYCLLFPNRPPTHDTPDNRGETAAASKRSGPQAAGFFVQVVLCCFYCHWG